LKKSKSFNPAYRQAGAKGANLLRKVLKVLIYNNLTLRTLRLLSDLCGKKILFQQPHNLLPIEPVPPYL
jgi:hypothetical protein